MSVAADSLTEANLNFLPLGAMQIEPRDPDLFARLDINGKLRHRLDDLCRFLTATEVVPMGEWGAFMSKECYNDTI